MKVVIGIGTNVDARRNMESVTARLARDSEVLAQSRPWWTPAMRSQPLAGGLASGPGGATLVDGHGHVPDAPPFLNAAAVVETPLRPVAMRRWLRAIERDHGRTRHGEPDAPRTLDLDVLAVDEGDGWQVDSVEAARPYHLLPLVEVLPSLRLDDGRTVREHALANPLPSAFPWTEGARPVRRPPEARPAALLGRQPPAGEPVRAPPSRWTPRP